jgi:hypothetical protein
MKELVILEGHPVVQDATEAGHPSGRVHFTAPGRIDADGAYRAYHPDNKSGLDDLRNAGGPGNWYGIVCDRNGKPFIQGANDPAPGFYVSATAYQWPGRAPSEPLRYVDAESVPYVVVSPLIRNAASGIVLGCKARISYNGRSVDAVVADIGPRKKIGELSIAAARALGFPSSPRTGGVESGVTYELWPGVPAVVNGVTYELIRA